MDGLTGARADREFAELSSRLDVDLDLRHPLPAHAMIDPPRGSDTPDLAAKARRLYDDRRRRAAVFGLDIDLFGEPAWDILLDLFMAWAERRTVRIGDACVAAAVPKTTALRWLDTLAHRRFIERMNDRSDGRSSNIRLTAKGVEIMRSYLAQVA